MSLGFTETTSLPIISDSLIEYRTPQQKLYTYKLFAEVNTIK